MAKNEKIDMTMEEALAEIARLRAGAPPDPMSAALEKLATIAEHSQKVQQAQLKQTAPRSNAQGPRTSAYNPRGEKDFPMPELKCLMMMPYEQKPGLHALDREEVELVNLVEPGKYMVEMNDGAVRPILLVGKRNRVTGHVDQIIWQGELDEDSGHPTPLFSGHNKQEFPSLKIILRQMLGQKSAFRDEENADKYGADDSPALDVMPMRTEQRKITEYLKATPEQRAEMSPDVLTKHPGAKHDGPLAISLGE